MDRTQSFPKSVRYCLSNRIDSLSLDILEHLVEAQYSTSGSKGVILKQADMALCRLRVLLRLAHDRRYLPNKSFEHLTKRLSETGRMLNGWRKQVAQ
jgi:hypothetical protein